MADNYEVGYGKPPEHTRFKKGHSGHPAGRPKGTPNLRSAIRRAAEEKVKVHIGDRTLTMHSIEAMAYKLVQKALGGDIKAVKAVIDLGGLDQSFADAAQSAATMGAEDLNLLRRALDRGGGQTPASPDPSTVETPTGKE